MQFHSVLSIILTFISRRDCKNKLPVSLYTSGSFKFWYMNISKCVVYKRLPDCYWCVQQDDVRRTVLYECRSMAVHRLQQYICSKCKVCKVESTSSVTSSATSWSASSWFISSPQSFHLTTCHHHHSYHPSPHHPFIPDSHSQILPSIDIWHLFGLISRIPGLLYGFFFVSVFF